MDSYWFLNALIPWLYLGVAAVLCQGLRRQDSVVRSGSPTRFSQAVSRAGGTGALVRGLWLDAVFIVLFLCVMTPLLAYTAGWWALLSVVAGGLDIVENVTLLTILRNHITYRRTRLLRLLATMKLLAYFGSLVVLLVAWRSIGN